ncbi:uncharacterized protein LOC102802147 [Saccoglossus kowalevskii]|uniref:Teneurin-3-like n=1 Tax=Saccoglossus kowalevskii TaxID=10224 RepID=A0ABM0M994_SACKO|nr:PREDICTED: teneurin-3-like [Saccoglossus kowalevskii]
MKYIILSLVIFGIAYVCAEAQGGEDDEDREDMNGRPSVCMNNSECNAGWCVHGMCRCPPNHYGDNCEDVSTLRCIVCDGFYHDELSACTTAWDLHPELDYEECEAHQTFCKSELWFKDGVPWIKRHGCSENCWEKEGCSPDKEGENCVACCQYDYCMGGEEYLFGGSKVITPSVILISLVSMFSYYL